jgi:hypothetical protein
LNILRLETNVPKEVTLQSAEGVVSAGRYGNRMMFYLADGQVMYVPPIVATKIEAQGIVAGERFELCKAEVKTGHRRSIEWLVKRIDASQSQEQTSSAPEPETPETQLERDLRVSADIAKAKKAEPEPPQPTTAATTDGIPPFAPIPNENGTAPAQNGNGRLPSVTKLEHALKTAISAAYNAEKYGTELGYVVRFDADAIKSMAITVLINMSEGGRR